LYGPCPHGAERVAGQPATGPQHACDVGEHVEWADQVVHRHAARDGVEVRDDDAMSDASTPSTTRDATPGRPVPGSQAWLDQVTEEVVDPDAPIVDPHHHLWPEGGALPYGLAEFEADVDSGHRIEATVFVECGAAYRNGGPEHLAPVGETEFVAAQAARASRPLIAGIVARADLRLGGQLDEVLDAHTEAGRGLFRGIRHALAHAEHPEELRIPGRAPAGLSADPAFRAGLACLGQRGLTYDTWHYHFQLREFAELARAVPDTVMVLDHFGTPLGVGRYASQREEIFEQWREDLAEVARCENVVAKLGGLAMPDNGFGWDLAERPATSDELATAQRRYYEHAIDCFGPERCMLESNFPVDRFSVSYLVLWNALKKLIADHTPDDRAAMLAGTARRVYRLD
jgi:L-fuconolactonase